MRSITFLLLRCLGPWWRIVVAFLVFQQLSNAQSGAVGNTSLVAYKLTEKIKLDGLLNESAWKLADQTAYFTNTKPAMGGRFPYATRVSVAYDNTAIYVGAVCYVLKKDRTDRLAARDEIYDNTDVFIAYFDTYHDRQNCFSFGVSTQNIQTDFRMAGEGYDGNWDAAWYSAVSVNDTAWVVEMRIPFDAIRFPNTKLQTWGVNFERQVVKKREIGEWSVIDNNRNDYVNMFNTLTGIANIEPPLRLALLPFVSSYTLLSKGQKTESTFKAGADVKWGINESLTLDATLVPDYKQVRSDRLVYNLGPYEVYYNEQRPFFTEGAELYNKHSDVFYTRRVGAVSNYYEEAYGNNTGINIVSQAPNQSNIVNAVKLTSKLKDGTGIGFFNAITSASYVDVNCDTCPTGTSQRRLFEPATDYSALVLDQPLSNNSFFSFITTHVLRRNSGHNASVIGATSKTIAKSGFFINTTFYHSSIFNRFHSRKNINNGLMYLATVGRMNRKLGYSITSKSVGHTFDPNDLGFLVRRNYRTYTANISYSLPQRTGKFEIQNNFLTLSYNTLYNRNVFTDFYIAINRFNILKWKYFGFGAYAELHPIGRHDYDETRSSQALYYNVPPTLNVSAFITTNYQKSVAIDVGIGRIKWYGEEARIKNNLNANLRLRPGKTWLLVASTELNYYNNQRAYIGRQSNKDALFGERNLWIIENSATLTQVLNNRSNIQLEARHYWLRSNYDTYFGLIATTGNLTQLQPLAYNNYDININFATFFLTYTWRFAPASDLLLTYKNDISYFNNNVYEGYSNNFKQLSGSALDNNSISLRANYYLEYGKAKQIINKLL